MNQVASITRSNLTDAYFVMTLQIVQKRMKNTLNILNKFFILVRILSLYAFPSLKYTQHIEVVVDTLFY